MSSELLNKYNELADQSQLFSPITTKPGKKEPTKDFSYSYKATTLMRIPKDAGIGLFTGKHEGQTKGVFAIDIDVEGDTKEARNITKMLVLLLPKLFTELAETSQTLTPSGGYHFYLESEETVLSHNSQSSVKLLFDGDTSKAIKLPIDVKAKGGFVVIAPSPYASAGKEWKKKFEGTPYKEIKPLNAQTIKTASPALIHFLNSKLSLNLIKVGDGYELMIWDTADVPTIEVESDDELDDIPESTKEDEEYFGFVRNEDCLKEVLNNLQGSNLDSYEDWLQAMCALIHVFGTPFGGEVPQSDFIYHFNRRCIQFPDNYNEANNIKEINNFWHKTAEKMLSFGHVTKMIKGNLGSEQEYAKWIRSLIDKGLFIEKIVQDTGKYKDFGDIANITSMTELSEVLEFFKSTIRYVTDGGRVKVFTKQLVEGIRPLPGIRFIAVDELDRYYQWIEISKRELKDALSDYSIITGKDKRKKDTYTKLSDLISRSEYRKGIVYKSSKFLPQCIYLDSSQNEIARLKEQAALFGSFNYAPDFRARVKYTREQAMNNADCKFLDNHLRNVLANGDDRAYRFLTGCLAHMVQRPHIKTVTFVIFRDINNGGTGKSVFADLIGAGIFGSLYKAYGKLEDYQHKFEIDKASKTFIWIDELNADNVDIDKLKSAISMLSGESEAKQVNKKTSENYNNIWAASNNTKVLAIKPGENRRYAIFDVAKNISKNKEYINRLININQDGLDAYFSYLMSINIEEETPFVPGQGFETAARKDQEASSICSSDKMFIDLINGEFDSRDNNGCVVTKVKGVVTGIKFHNASIYDEYTKHITKIGRRPLNQDNLLSKLKSLFGVPYRVEINKVRRIGYKLTIDEVKAAIKISVTEPVFDDLTNIKDEEPEPQKDNNADSSMSFDDDTTKHDNIIDDPTTRLEYTDDWLNDDLAF